MPFALSNQPGVVMVNPVNFYTYSQNYFLGVGVRLIESDNSGRSPMVINKTDAVSMRLFFWLIKHQKGYIKGTHFDNRAIHATWSNQ